MRFIRFHTLIACWGLVSVGMFGMTSSASIAAAPDDIVLTQGTVITVTSVSDEVNGNVSTVAGLVAGPGPDGVSLREAIEATNRDPGLYTIEFAPTLVGQTIDAAGELPWLEAGGLIINGDIDGDEEPDITIRAASATDNVSGLTVSSSDNTLHAIELVGDWVVGVSLSPPTPGATYANTTVANMVIRGVRNGILLNAPGWPADSRVTEHRWVNTRIIGNQIDATYEGVSVQLAKTIGDVVEGLVISDNDIHLGGGTEPVSAPIGLMAGFWDGSSANRITDVVISDNTVTGAEGTIVLATGAVGASANSISGVRIVNNAIRVSGLGGILVMASDASTAWIDPSYTPVAYPDDNVISDIEISDNTIEWTGDIGIQVTAGGPGSRNSVSDVRIVRNELIGSAGPISAISINTGGGSDAPEDAADAVGNRVSGVRVEDNTIRVSGGPYVGPPQFLGAIVLVSGETMAVEHQLSDVQVSGNQIDNAESSLPGILLQGGGPNTTGNQLTGVELTCNRITGAPEILMIGAKGPNASGNIITGVVLSGNLTGDLLNNVSSQPDTEGATGNEVAWTATDGIPAGCSITAPSPPTTSIETPTASESVETEPTPDERATDSPEFPWVWVIGAAVAVILAASLLLLARRRSSRRASFHR